MTPSCGGVVRGVVEQVVDRPVKAFGDALDEHGLERALVADVREVASGANQRFVHNPVQANVLGRADWQITPGQLDDVADQCAELLGLLEHVGEQAPAILPGELISLLEQHLDVRAQAGDRRAQLVRGVGHKLALGADRLIERVARDLKPLDHRVEAPGQKSHLIVGVDSDPAAQILCLLDMLGGRGDLGQRGEHLPCRQPSEGGREGDPAGAHAAAGRGEGFAGCSRCRRAGGRAGPRRTPAHRWTVTGIEKTSSRKRLLPTVTSVRKASPTPFATAATRELSIGSPRLPRCDPSWATIS